MSHHHIPDDIVVNILARIPGKPLLRFRCVSTHWNRLISDPYFMKLRSRRMILFPFPRSFAVIDDNVPVKDKAHSMFRIRSLLEHQESVEVSVAGTFNGIVLLVLIDMSLRSRRLILYNPLTCASKMILEMGPSTSRTMEPWAFGFGYGETPNDLKIIIIGISGIPNRNRYTCDTFDLKTSSWGRSHYLTRRFFFCNNAGMFLNGFLYWLSSLDDFKILSLNVKDMVFSKINLPCIFQYLGACLSSLKGCLCTINKFGASRFDLWVMKEQGIEDSWFKETSFIFGLNRDHLNQFHTSCILDNGKILLTDGSNKLVMYDTSNDTYETLDGLADLDHLKKNNVSHNLSNMHSIEYIESLVSPSDICYM